MICNVELIGQCFQISIYVQRLIQICGPKTLSKSRAKPFQITVRLTGNAFAHIQSLAKVFMLFGIFPNLFP